MKLAEALKTIQAAPPDAPPLEVALLCGFTPLHLQTFLEAQLCKLFPGHSPRVQVGLFGDLMGNLRRVADVAVAVVVIEWADLDPRLGLRRLGGWEPSQLPDILDEVSRSCELLEHRIREAAGNVPLVLCLPTLPLPPISFTPLARASEFSIEDAKRWREMTMAFASEAPHIFGVLGAAMPSFALAKVLFKRGAPRA